MVNKLNSGPHHFVHKTNHQSFSAMRYYRVQTGASKSAKFTQLCCQFQHAVKLLGQPFMDLELVSQQPHAMQRAGTTYTGHMTAYHLRLPQCFRVTDNAVWMTLHAAWVNASVPHRILVCPAVYKGGRTARKYNIEAHCTPYWKANSPGATIVGN